MIIINKTNLEREGSVNLQISGIFFFFIPANNLQQLTEPANVNTDSFFRVKYYITPVYILKWNFN